MGKALYSLFAFGFIKENRKMEFFKSIFLLTNSTLKKVFMPIEPLLGPSFIFRMGLGAHRVQREIGSRLRSVLTKSRVALGKKGTRSKV